ncbi:MAG TPA: polymer-forming cytoskeletal protein [Atribacteraceae bacterium]|nr:polymer-forming cytoskeletal protein [Atribacteraceae bacterium]
MNWTERLSACRDTLQFRFKSERIYTFLARHPIEAVFPAGTLYSGVIEAEGLVRIEGRCQGTVRAPMVVIARGSLVTAEIKTHCLYVEGHFRGQATTAFLYLAEGSLLEGEVRTESLFTETGAACKGKLIVEKGTNGYACDIREIAPSGTTKAH